MSHEIDQSNNRSNIAYTGETPWHGLGQRVEEGDDIDVWREAAGLDWTAEKAQVLFYPGDDPSTTTKSCEPELKAEGRFVLHRSDTNAVLNIVSDRYNAVQPDQILQFFKMFTGESGFDMHTLGSLSGGKKVWGLAKASEGLIDLAGDKIMRFLLFATSYDSSIATTVMQTSIRVVCNNTLAAAYQKNGKLIQPALRMKHLKRFDPKTVREEMRWDEDWAEFSNMVDKFAGKGITTKQLEEFLYEVLDTVTPSEVGITARQARAIGRRVDLLKDIAKYAPGQDMVSAKGTVWGAVNAVTYFVDHDEKARSADSRLDRSWFGEGAKLKTKALELAVELAA